MKCEETHRVASGVTCTRNRQVNEMINGGGEVSYQIWTWVAENLVPRCRTPVVQEYTRSLGGRTEKVPAKAIPNRVSEGVSGEMKERTKGCSRTRCLGAARPSSRSTHDSWQRGGREITIPKWMRKCVKRGGKGRTEYWLGCSKFRCLGAARPLCLSTHGVAKPWWRWCTKYGGEIGNLIFGRPGNGCIW